MELRKVNLPWTTVWSKTSTEVFLPATPWMPAAEFTDVRASVDLRARAGDLEVAVGIQFADVENSPDAGHTVIGSAQNQNGVKYPTAFTSVSSAGKQLARLGWVTKNTSSSDLNLGRVAGQVESRRCG